MTHPASDGHARPNRAGWRIERATDKHQLEFEPLICFKSRLLSLWGSKHEWPRNVLILGKGVCIRRRRRLEDCLVRARHSYWAGPSISALRDATEAPESMPEAASQHITLVDGRHF